MSPLCSASLASVYNCTTRGSFAFALDCEYAASNGKSTIELARTQLQTSLAQSVGFGVGERTHTVRLILPLARRCDSMTCNYECSACTERDVSTNNVKCLLFILCAFLAHTRIRQTGLSCATCTVVRPGKGADWCRGSGPTPCYSGQRKLNSPLEKRIKMRLSQMAKRQGFNRHLHSSEQAIAYSVSSHSETDSIIAAFSQGCFWGTNAHF